jgi:nucleotide-binding universal stress UspA family protein
MMYGKILVPLDGSGLAEVALPYAEQLARRLHSDIHLIYVTESAEVPQHYIHRFYLQKIGEATKEGAGRDAGEPVGKPVKVAPTVLVGNPAEEIVDYADREDVSLIVMATHGRSGISRWALGSVAEKVVRATSRPVALIRAKGARADVREKGAVNKVLVPLDGSKRGEAAIPYVEELATELKAQVILLQVVPPIYLTPNAEQLKEQESFRLSAEDYINKVAAQFKHKGIEAKSELREVTVATVAEEIINIADEICADLVAMSTRGRTEVGLWAFGSVADRVLRHGNTPLLLVRPPAGYAA